MKKELIQSLTTTFEGQAPNDHFVDVNKTIDRGSVSHKYLNNPDSLD